MLRKTLYFILISFLSVASAKNSADAVSCRAGLHGATSILVIGGGSNGFLSESLIEGLDGKSFLTASRTEHEAWAGSQGHRSGIDRNDASAVSALLNEMKPAVILDAAGAHMGDSLNYQSIEAAHAAGWAQAQVMISYLSRREGANLIFISSQYANAELKNSISIDKTFAVLGIAKPVSIRLYAEMKAGYEDALLDYQRRTGRTNFVILRLGTLLSKGYRSESILALLKTDEIPRTKNFTPSRVLADSLGAIVERFSLRTAVPQLLEVSSRGGFADPKRLGVAAKPLQVYVNELRSAWGR